MTSLIGKCGECDNYIPMRTIGRGELVISAKGHCKAKGTIVQRTDKKCKKNFKKE